jgi:hypothetical protein
VRWRLGSDAIAADLLAWLATLLPDAIKHDPRRVTAR